LPLEDAELAVIRQGLEQVVTGSSGTARGTFAGFPLDRFPIAGKTGTAQLRSGETTLNDAWFVSYSPTDDAEYLVAVLVEEAGHGGTSAGPIARQIWEGIFGLDKKAEVTLGSDASG
jgi:penicillin-binding protein 2